MFQFPRLPPRALCVRARVAGVWSRWVFPFGDPRVDRASAPNRGLSQLVTSFFGFLCQGIRRLPLPSSLLRFDGTNILARAGSRPRDSLRCDLSRNVLVTLCGSQGAAGSAPGDRMLRARAGAARTGERVDGRRLGLPRKEVIQPHLPVRLPCYDFTPLTLHTFGASPLTVGPATSGADDSGGVTGGVYKARERIHRGVLIRDY